MINVKNNYKDLLECYSVASEHFQRTGSTRLLKFVLGELERFERIFIECYSVEELSTLQGELGSQGLLIV